MRFYHDQQSHADAVCHPCFWKDAGYASARSTFMRESKRGFDGDATIYVTDDTTDPDIWVTCNNCGRKSSDYDDRPQ